MWKCPNCNEEIEEQFDSCWSCGRSQDGRESDQPVVEEQNRTINEMSEDLILAKWLCWTHITISSLLVGYILNLRFRIIHSGNIDLRWNVIHYSGFIFVGVILGFVLWLRGSIVAYSKMKDLTSPDDEKNKWKQQ